MLGFYFFPRNRGRRVAAVRPRPDRDPRHARDTRHADRVHELQGAREGARTLQRLRKLPMPELRNRASLHALLREPQGEKLNNLFYNSPFLYKYLTACSII